MPQEEMSKKLGVGRKTLYRWRQDEEFQTVYQSILDEKLSDIDDSPYAHRVDRINEMFRLYLKIDEKVGADSVTVGYKPVTKLQQTSSAWWSIFKSGRQQMDKHS
jgi:hypothetical protein